MSNQGANGRWKHFALKIVCPEKFPVQFGWDPGRAFGVYTFKLAYECLQGFNSGWQAGSVLFTSSVDMEIGASPRRLIASTIGLLASRERKAVIQVFLDRPTNLQSQMFLGRCLIIQESRPELVPRLADMIGNYQ